jgi:hemerythrin-like metal-binding protein
MRLIWNSSLETGVRQIDLQHQELIELINELEAAHEGGHDDAALDDVLPRLTAYVLFHFGTEEGLVGSVAAGSPHALHHLGEHRKFGEKVAAMRAGSRDYSARSVAELLDYLKSWLVDHIMKTDKELARMINSRRA